MATQVGKILYEMQAQLQKQQGDLQNANGVSSELTSRNKAIDLTLAEVAQSDKPEVWESCGKAFLRADKPSYEEKLKQEKKDNVELLNDLNKKKHYLETSINATVDNMNKVLDKVEAKK